MQELSKKRLNNNGSIIISYASFNTIGCNFLSAIAAQFINSQAVLFKVHEFKGFFYHFLVLAFVKRTFKNTVLYALTIVA